MISVVWKMLSVIAICVMFGFSGFFSTDDANASYLIEKRCMQNQSSKRSLEARKKICACVVMNLQSRLQPEHMKEMEQIYEGRRSRVAASKDERLKTLVDLDFEVNKNCIKNSMWGFPKEDLGTPDPL